MGLSAADAEYLTALAAKRSWSAADKARVTEIIAALDSEVLRMSGASELATERHAEIMAGLGRIEAEITEPGTPETPPPEIYLPDIQITGPTTLGTGEAAQYYLTTPGRWSTSGGATVDAEGRFVAGNISGTHTITAQADGGWKRTMLITVRGGGSGGGEPEPPPEGDDPTPGMGDTVYLDARSGGADSIQGAANKSAADTILDQGTNRWDTSETGVAFTTDADGAGARGYRYEWSSWGGTPGDQALRSVYSIPGTSGSKTKHVYIQWQMWMGRTSTGGGVGDIGAFDLFNEDDPGGNAGRKIVLVLRDGVGGGGDGRIDFDFPGPEPSQVRFEGFYNISGATNLVINRGSFDPDEHYNEWLTITMRLKAESSEGAGDGEVDLWINGTQYMEHRNKTIGHMGFDRIHFSDTFRSPKFQMTDYWKGFAVWSPA